MFDAAQAAFGPITALVNNAGVVAPKSMLADMTLERMRRIFDINVLGAYLVAREGARRMPTDRGGKGGAIVNVSSVAARLGSPGQYLDYAGSKGAVDTLTIGLAKELAAGGVRVNGVRPGIIETDIHTSGGEPDRAALLGPSAPMGRAGTAGEVAEAIIWLLSDAASYVTGTAIDISGGR
jgi:NAD(P)-dependent dehydrogenase (short-subunit alcohol dehydrogenase family)